MDHRVELIYRVLLTDDSLKIWFADNCELVGLWATTPVCDNKVNEARFYVLELIRDSVE